MTENQKAANEDDRTKTLKRLCETRWASRLDSFSAIVSNFEVILVTLEEISEENGKVGAEAHSLLAACSTFEFLFFVTLLHEIFQVTSVLSEYLQRSRLSVGAAMEMAVSCRRMLNAKRTAENFEILWARTERRAQQLDLGPKLQESDRYPKELTMVDVANFTTTLSLFTDHGIMKFWTRLPIRWSIVLGKTLYQF